ncbi:MAG: acetoin utilization protein AcuC, partial [Chloroflexota bacterium]|nr:acetoin utilization protein AcuC [Chloroflexota bacterium]
MSRKAAFVYSNALAGHVLREDHPMKPVRLRYTYELLSAYGAFKGDTSTLAAPRMATDAELLTFHTPEYVDAVKRISRGDFSADPARFNLSIGGDNPFYQGMYEANALAAGSALVAAELVVSGKANVAFAPAGGLHHAMASYASGFCVFNDPVLAIKLMLSKGMRVAYIDIDAHHGDGVERAFYEDNRVLTISLHESGLYLFPGTGFPKDSGEGAGRGYAVDVPLAPYT